MKLCSLSIPGLVMGLILALNGKANVTEQDTSAIDTPAGNILVINSYDARSEKMRKNKKALFIELADSLKQVLYEGTPVPNGKMIIIPELIKDSLALSNIVDSLMIHNGASKAIVITYLDAYFVQTHVNVVKEADGKDRTAYYDICSVVTYRLYDTAKKFEDAQIRNCEFFTSRNVVSGLFAAGPDVVGKKKHVFEMIRKNALEYLATEKPWK